MILDISPGGGRGNHTYGHPLILPHFLHWIHPDLKEQYLKQEDNFIIDLTLPKMKDKDLTGFIYIVQFKERIEDENSLVIKVGKTKKLNQRFQQHENYAFFGLDIIKIYETSNIDVDESRIIYEASLLGKQLKTETFLLTREGLNLLISTMNRYFDI